MFSKQISLFLIISTLNFGLEEETQSTSAFIVLSTSSPPISRRLKNNRLKLEIDLDQLILDKLENLLENELQLHHKIVNDVNIHFEEIKKEIMHGNQQVKKCSHETEHKNLQQHYTQLANKLDDLERKQKDYFQELKNEIVYELEKQEHRQVEYCERLVEQQRDNNLVKYKEIIREQIVDVFNKVNLPKNCEEIQKRGNTLSGVYRIRPDYAPASFEVWCDMETMGGGWIYALNRFDGSQNFNLSWKDYKLGFGNLHEEFWLGLEHLYILSGRQPSELLIELTDQNMNKAYANYRKFSIGDEEEEYMLKIVSEYNGNAGNDFGLQMGWKFSTVDRDQDIAVDNCAAKHGGGSWYADCYYCLFTGVYESANKTGMECITFRGYDQWLKQVKMMIKQK